MTADLKTVTASKAELEKEIAERRKAIDALSASERKYRNLFENMTEEVHFWQVVRDDTGQIKTWRLVDVNPPALKTWNRTAVDEIRGQSADEIFGPGATQHYMPVVQKIMTEGVPQTFEDYFLHLDKYFRFTSVPLGDYFITTGTDITDIRKTEESLRNTLNEKEVLLKEIHHRVKNNMQVISSMVALQADEARDAGISGVLKEVTYRVHSMAMVHEKLYQSADLAKIDFADYTKSLLNYLWRSHGTAASGIRIDFDLSPVLLPVNTAVPCGLILNELFTNALKHAFRGRDNGLVSVSLDGNSQGQVRLCIRDNGTGLPQEMDWQQSRSLGLRLVKTLARQLHAVVEVASAEGTQFTIIFERPTI